MGKLKLTYGERMLYAGEEYKPESVAVDEYGEPVAFFLDSRHAELFMASLREREPRECEEPAGLDGGAGGPSL